MTIKKAILRGLLGAPLGVFIGYTITIIVSLLFKSGSYYSVVPQLKTVMGSELKAVILQYLLSAVLGFAAAAGSAVFEVEEWGITKQTIIHFFILTVSMFPIAYLCYWMEHTLLGILFYIGIFVALYLIIWVIQMNLWKKRIEGINQRLKGNKEI